MNQGEAADALMKGAFRHAERIMRFETNIKPGSAVWQDERQNAFGTTVGGVGVYKDKKLPFVNVTNINDQPGKSGSWNAESVEPKLD